jgi:hypothetical protein
LPRVISHCGASFDVEHLDQHIETCNWIGGAGAFSCAVKFRYSTHCYSFEHDGSELAEGTFTFKDREQTRVFCPDRHAHSLELPRIFREICAKPTSSVQVTIESNYAMYRLTMPIKLPQGENYWMFFHADREKGNRGSPLAVSVFVESAYPRKLRPVTVRRMPFGKVLEEI